MREGKETARFLSNVPEIGEAKRLTDDIKQIAVLPGGHIGPFPRRPLARAPAGETDEHGTPRCVLHIADHPVSASAMAGRQVVAAHRLGLPTETLRQLGCVVSGHQAATRSPMRSTGQRSKSLPRIVGPLESTGTKKRSFQEMISLKSP